MTRCLLASAALALVLAAPAKAGLTLEESFDAAATIWSEYEERFAAETAAELEAEAIEAGDHTLRFRTLQFTDGVGTPCAAPCASPTGEPQPLFISMHGGGGAPPEVNDKQWDNQVALGATYAPQEGIYLAPRAPTDTWNCWHSAAVDPLFARLIRALIAAGTVDPNRVYLMGYSAGGDGVYALAPRMADRFAAASMMAGSPNGVLLNNVRNLPFSIQVGALDSAYDRANIAKHYGKLLEDLQAKDPDGYAHFTEIHEGKGHWMDTEDRIAVPWMEGFTRDITAERIVWRQTGMIYDRFYWLAVPPGEAQMDEEIIAERADQTITLSGPSGRTVFVRLNDDMLDLDQPVTVVTPGGDVLFDGIAERSEDVISKTVEEYGDLNAVFTAEIEVTLP